MNVTPEFPERIESLVHGLSGHVFNKTGHVNNWWFQDAQSGSAISLAGTLEGDGALLHLEYSNENGFVDDLIFAVVANRWGFLGCTLLLGTYLWLLCAILLVAVRQRDPAGRLICVGVFAILGFQAFVNIAMTIGLMPIAGMTLPFVSYGGTSLVVSMLSVALVSNVAGRPSFEFGRGDFA